jgi:hypothetical protein
VQRLLDRENMTLALTGSTSAAEWLMKSSSVIQAKALLGETITGSGSLTGLILGNTDRFTPISLAREPRIPNHWHLGTSLRVKI